MIDEKQEIECTRFEPIIKHRFMARFEDIPNYAVRNVSNIKFIKGKYQDIIIKLYDIVTPSITKRLTELITGRSSESDDFTLKLQILGEEDDIIREWIIRTHDISIDFGNFDYASDSLNSIIITMLNPRCILNF